MASTDPQSDRFRKDLGEIVDLHPETEKVNTRLAWTLSLSLLILAFIFFQIDYTDFKPSGMFDEPAQMMGDEGTNSPDPNANPSPARYCGDGNCNEGEDGITCPGDCGTNGAYGGDGDGDGDDEPPLEDTPPPFITSIPLPIPEIPETIESMCEFSEYDTCDGSCPDGEDCVPDEYIGCYCDILCSNMDPENCVEGWCVRGEKCRLNEDGDQCECVTVNCEDEDPEDCARASCPRDRPCIQTEDGSGCECGTLCDETCMTCDGDCEYDYVCALVDIFGEPNDPTICSVTEQDGDPQLPVLQKACRCIEHCESQFPPMCTGACPDGGMCMSMPGKDMDECKCVDPEIIV